MQLCSATSLSVLLCSLLLLCGLHMYGSCHLLLAVLHFASFSLATGVEDCNPTLSHQGMAVYTS